MKIGATQVVIVLTCDDPISFLPGYFDLSR